MYEVYQIKYLGKDNDSYFYHLAYEGGLVSSDNDLLFDNKFDALSSAVDEICDGDSSLEIQLKRDIKISEIVE